MPVRHDVLMTADGLCGSADPPGRGGTDPCLCGERDRALHPDRHRHLPRLSWTRPPTWTRRWTSSRTPRPAAPPCATPRRCCLVHSAVAAEFLPRLDKRLVDDRAAAGLDPVELRLDDACRRRHPRHPRRAERDFDTEFLDYILAVRVVDSVERGHRAHRWPTPPATARPS